MKYHNLYKRIASGEIKTWADLKAADPSVTKSAYNAYCHKHNKEPIITDGRQPRQMGMSPRCHALAVNGHIKKWSDVHDHIPDLKKHEYRHWCKIKGVSPIIDMEENEVNKKKVKAWTVPASSSIRNYWDQY